MHLLRRAPAERGVRTDDALVLVSSAGHDGRLARSPHLGVDTLGGGLSSLISVASWRSRRAVGGSNLVSCATSLILSRWA
jgi:hypothetical protein